MAEQERREIPYKGIHDFYKSLSPEKQKKFDDLTENIIKGLRFAGDIVNLSIDLTGGYVKKEILGIKRESEHETKIEQSEQTE